MPVESAAEIRQHGWTRLISSGIWRPACRERISSVSSHPMSASNAFRANSVTSCLRTCVVDPGACAALHAQPLVAQGTDLVITCQMYGKPLMTMQVDAGMFGDHPSTSRGSCIVREV